ncbi:MAG: cysteine desulfurase [Tissierellia bacterium]|nr:cysteine desulfurase [Tissierellia bacterium]
MYFDHASTSPPSDSLNRSLYELSLLSRYNPSSSHKEGLELRKRLQRVRLQVGKLIGAPEDEIYFTSGATEANNLALQGLCFNKKGHILSSAVEHASIEEALVFLESRGFNVTRLDPKNLTNKEIVLDNLREDTFMVSIMTVQNETGENYPLDGLGKALSKRGIIYHRDSVQAFGKIPVNVKAQGIDLASFSSHKLGGLKGLGILYCRKSLGIHPLFFGGGQEKGLRPGTENTLGILALGKVLEERNLSSDYLYVKDINARLRTGFEQLGGSLLSTPQASPYILAVSFPIPSEVLLTALSLKGVYVSAGSACHANSGKEARIVPFLENKELGRGMLRFSISTDTSLKEVEDMLEILSATLKELIRYL